MGLSFLVSLANTELVHEVAANRIVDGCTCRFLFSPCIIKKPQSLDKEQSSLLFWSGVLTFFSPAYEVVWMGVRRLVLCWFLTLYVFVLSYSLTNLSSYAAYKNICLAQLEREKEKQNLLSGCFSSLLLLLF